MGLRNVFIETENEFFEIAGRFKRRDFSGNTGKAIKNSTWQILTMSIAKIGSLIFTILMARILMPELFGLYGLAIATILFIGSFTELGITTTIIRFLSKEMDKNKVKAKATFIYLTKFKLFLIFIGTIFIVLSANYFANYYYNKPIYFAILAGVIYFPLTMLYNYFGNLFTTRNNFKINFIGEIIYQVLRLVFVPLFTLYITSHVISQELITLSVILSLSFILFLTSIYFYISFLRDNPFKGIKNVNLSKREKSELWYFTLPLTLTIFSGVFFNYIDTIMLGHYVSAEFIGYYRAAFTLIAAAAAIISFSSSSLMPIFTRLKGKNLVNGFRKARLITIIITIPAMLFTIVISRLIILLVFGLEYAPATIILQLFSLLLITLPITSLYETYYISQGKTKLISILLFLTTILNIVLNFFFITVGLENAGMQGAVIGASLATIISRFAYLFFLAFYRKIIRIKN